MNIVGKHVTLRAIEPNDLAVLNVWANDAELQLLIGGWHFPTSMNDQAKWLSDLSCASTNQRFAIETQGQGLVGTANLVSIDWKNRTATHGVMIGNRNARRHGFALDAVMSVMRYAFDELGLARLDSDIIENNIPSQNLYVKKCGWSVEGRRSKWYYRNGTRWDKVMIGIDERQYRELIATTHYWAVP